MQKINYKEKIQLNSKINELLLINIDEKLIQSRESDCLKVSGEIKVSGEVNSDDGKKEFNHPIGVDIMLSKEQLIDNEVKIAIDDFNYTIEDDAIIIELIMKIDGLKEIEAYFPTQEDQKDTQIENSREEEIPIVEEIIEQKDESIVEGNIEEKLEETPQKDSLYVTFQEIVQDHPYIEEEPIHTKEIHEKAPAFEEEKKEKYSLLNSVFKNRSIKKETSYLLHVVKEETSYEQIANIYKIDPIKIKSANKDEEIYKGKLIFIPKQ